jgi:hypothetical protein
MDRDRSRERRERGPVVLAVSIAVGAVCLALASTAVAAGPGEEDGAKGLFFARKGDCDRAARYLEAALAAHPTHQRPTWEVALADCRKAAGDLIAASALYRKVLAETPARGWGRPDYNAAKAAKQKADEVEARIPTLRLRLGATYEGLEVAIDGVRVTDLDLELRVRPGSPVALTARARGRRPLADTLTLREGERRVVVLALEPSGAHASGDDDARPASAAPTDWLGFRYYGVVIPRFVMRLVADGGTNLVVPGGAFTYTTRTKRADLTFALGYLSYAMGATPFKPHGQPDTEWELVGSTLQGFTASVEMLWTFPMDAAERASFRIGGALGFGWMALGDMTRVQSYPATGMPGDPATYLPCRGPNNPMGTFRYCNALDKDATHYPGYTEPDWFHGGIRPSLFPWVVLPQLGFSFKPSRVVAIDLDTGVSISGFLTSLGVRVGL